LLKEFIKNKLPGPIPLNSLFTALRAFLVCDNAAWLEANSFVKVPTDFPAALAALSFANNYFLVSSNLFLSSVSSLFSFPTPKTPKLPALASLTKGERVSFP